MAAAVAQVVSLNHISRESSDIRRLADFYKEVLQPSNYFFLITLSASWSVIHRIEFVVVIDIWIRGDREPRLWGIQGDMAEFTLGFFYAPYRKGPKLQASWRTLERHVTGSRPEPSSQRPPYLLLCFQFRILCANTEGMHPFSDHPFGYFAWFGVHLILLLFCFGVMVWPAKELYFM